MKTDNWNPVWLTTKDFEDITPGCMYHREQEPNPAPIGPKNMHVLVRGIFSLGNMEKNALLRIRISADDYYKAWLDSSFLGQGPAPGIPEEYYYNEYFLNPDDVSCNDFHLLGLHLYYQGVINRVWNSGDGRFAMAVSLTLIDKVGETEVPVKWSYKVSDAFSGDTVGYDTQYLENIDLRKWDPSWNKLKGSDAGFSPMVPAGWADYVLNSTAVTPVTVYRCRPIKSTVLSSLESILDFGTEITAGLYIKATSQYDGAKIILRCGEEKNEDGSVRYDMRCMCRYEEVITCKEGENEISQYDYKGFRYVQVLLEEGIENPVIEAEVRHYPMDENACVFSGENKILSDIFEICKRGVMYGTQEGYLDCPTREKGQYLGDAIITSRSQVWLSGSTDMLKKCICQFCNTSMIDEGLMGVAPGSFMQEIADFSLLFPEMLKTYYEFTGDKTFIKQYEPYVENMLKHFSKYAGEKGLLYQVADKWNLVDWPENLRDNYDFPLTRPVVAPGCHNVINALYIGALETDNYLRTVAGLPALHNTKPLKEAFLRAFFDYETGLFTDSANSSHSSVHANLYPLYFGLIPVEYIDGVCDFLVQKGLCCGVMISSFMLRGLAKTNRIDDMYGLLTNTSQHSWVQMLRDGATTCFEAWGKEQKWNTSLCHPWASAPVYLLIEDIIGIHPDPMSENGFSIQPKLPEAMQDFSLSLRISGKKITASYRDGHFSYSIL